MTGSPGRLRHAGRGRTNFPIHPHRHNTEGSHMTSTPHPATATATRVDDLVADGAAVEDTVDPWAAPDLCAARIRVGLLDTAEQRCRATADRWTHWAAELAALRARMPDSPALSDPDCVEATAITRATHIDPAGLRRDLAPPLAAADHLAAVYSRHADLLTVLLSDAVEDAYPPPEPTTPELTTTDPGTDRGAW